MYRTTFHNERKQWNGQMTKSDFNPDASLGNVILNSLFVHGSRVAQICANTNKTTTFHELRELTVRAAKNLRNFGCRKGQVVLFLTNNTADISPLVFAALCLGCTVAPLHISCSKAECLYFLTLCKSEIVFCDLKFHSMLKECFEKLETNVEYFTFDGQTDGTHSINSLFEEVEDSSYFNVEEINGTNHVAIIIRSSGTTGMPKGVLISHACILDTARRISSILQATDIRLSFHGLGGIAEMRYLLIAPLNGYARIVNPGSFSPERFFDLVKRFKVTFVNGCPAPIIAQLLSHPHIDSVDLSSVKLIMVGFSKAPLKLIAEMNKTLPNGKCFRSYGMSELVGPVAINIQHSRNDCVGQLISGAEAKVVNEEGQRLGVGEIGELCIRQPFRFSGYVGNAEKTDNFDDEGFFATGDIVYFDENCDLFIVDRKKAIFKVSHNQVTPTEIEAFLDQIDGVKKSCLVAIPDMECGNLPAAVIVKEELSNCTEESIYESVLNTFAHYKRLQGGVYFVDSLPMTSTGKIARILVTGIAIGLYNKKNRCNNLKMNASSNFG